MKELKPKPDLKDNKILSKIEFDARIPISKLAKKVRISKEVALYRIRKLEQTRIIKQYYAVINTAKLGYFYCRLLIKFQNIDEEIEEKIIEFLKEDPKIAYLGILDGSWDLLIGYWAKSIIEFGEFINNFIFRYGRYILDKEILFNSYMLQFPYMLLSKQEFKTGDEIEKEKIDNIDKKLLILLTKNARLGYEELSKEIPLTGKAISNRIKNLEKKKIIVGYRTLLDYNKLGYFYTKVFLYLKDLTKEELDKLIAYLGSLKNCVYILKSIGKPDLDFDLLTKNREEFRSIIDELRKNFKNIIRNYDQVIIHKEPISRFIPIVEV